MIHGRRHTELELKMRALSSAPRVRKEPRACQEPRACKEPRARKEPRTRKEPRARKERLRDRDTEVKQASLQDVAGRHL